MIPSPTSYNCLRKMVCNLTVKLATGQRSITKTQFVCLGTVPRSWIMGGDERKLWIERCGVKKLCAFLLSGGSSSWSWGGDGFTCWSLPSSSRVRSCLARRSLLLPLGSGKLTIFGWMLRRRINACLCPRQERSLWRCRRSWLMKALPHRLRAGLTVLVLVALVESTSFYKLRLVE